MVELTICNNQYIIIDNNGNEEIVMDTKRDSIIADGFYSLII